MKSFILLAMFIALTFSFGSIMIKDLRKHLLSGQLSGGLSVEEQQIMAQETMNFMQSDQQIMDALMKDEEPSEEIMMKLGNFMVNNDKVRRLIIKQSSQQPGNEWIANLKPQAQKRFLKITFENMQQGVFEEGREISPETSNKIMLQLAEDDEIATEMVKSFPDEVFLQNEQFIKNKFSQYKDWNFKKLTIEQKVELFRKAINDPEFIANMNEQNQAGGRQGSLRAETSTTVQTKV